MRTPLLFGLRVEILIQIIFLLTASLLLTGLLFLRAFEREIVQERLDRIADQMENYARLASLQGNKSPEWVFLELQKKFLLDGWARVDQGLQPVVRKPEYLLHDAELRLVQSSLEPFLQFNFTSQWWRSGDQDFVRITVPLIQYGRFSGALQARFPLHDIRRKISSIRNLMVFYAGGYGILLIGFGYYLLTRTLVLPVRRLLHATQDVAAGNLRPLVAVGGPKEISDLAESFNRMTGALEASRAESYTYIHSLQEANEELQRTRDELIRTEKMAATCVLATGMAHELGNPLSAVIGYLEFLKGQPSRQQDCEVLSRALAETARMDRLLRDLLDCATPAAAETEPVDPAAVLAEATEILSRQNALAGIGLDIEMPSSLPSVLLARQHLLQVFLNLLLNARDASPPGSVIHLFAQEEGGLVRVSVADEGCGMAPAIRARIFDPFFTTKPPGKGRGLGLSFCQRVLEEAGGRIEVRSEAGKGSEFTLWMRKAAPPT